MNGKRFSLRLSGGRSAYEATDTSVTSTVSGKKRPAREGSRAPTLGGVVVRDLGARDELPAAALGADACRGEEAPNGRERAGQRNT